jgi:anti-sigma factor (TIGR02949 family)
MKSILRFLGFGRRSHNCIEIVSKLEELIDGEVDEITEQRLIAEIQRCPACLKHYDLDKSFKDFLQKKVERRCCAEKVKAQILEKINAIES